MYTMLSDDKGSEEKEAGRWDRNIREGKGVRLTIGGELRPGV